MTTNTSYGTARVDAFIDGAPAHGLTEDDFALAVIACADQAGVDLETQERIRALVEASRSRAPTPDYPGHPGHPVTCMRRCCAEAA